MLAQPMSYAAPASSYMLPVLGRQPPLCASSDEALIAAVRSGNVAAYGELVLKYQSRLCASLFHICGSRTDAEDAAQEAFLRAFTKLSSYTGASAFYTWLYRIAVNAVITQRRRHRTWSEGERVRSRPDDAACPAAERPDQRMLRAERAIAVQKALAALSDEYRTILVLREVEDFDYDEIATTLEIPLGTVRSRLHRARLELRRVLEVQGE